MSRRIQAVNQPDRISWNSFSDPNTSSSPSNYQFQVPLNTPALDVEEIQLLRASVPQIANAIPSYQLVFYFYELATATTAPSQNNLFNIRLYPYGYTTPPTISPLNITVMTALTGGATELVALLNAAAGPTGDSVVLNPTWGGGKVTFSLVNGQIVFKGIGAGKFYTPAGYNDPNVIANQVPGGPGALPPVINYVPTDAVTASLRSQPYALGYTMNARLGYAMSGQAVGAFANPGAYQTNLLYANSFNSAFPSGTNIPPDSFYNITGSSIVSIYGSFSGSGGNSTTNNRLNLLGVIPLDTTTGYTNFTGVGLKAPLYKVMNDIYVIDIELQDENGQPFYVPDNGNVNLEISFKYKNTNKPRAELPMAHY